MKKTAIAILALALSGPAAADAGAMGDPEIAHTAYSAGQIDIRYAHLALALSEDETVRAFARTMIRDHSAVNDAAGGLIAELNVTPRDNELSRALLRGAAETRAELSGLSGGAFDCAYARNELAYHRLVNETVAERFIPAVTVAPLRELLQEALVTFRQHEGHAEAMVAELECSS